MWGASAHRVAPGSPKINKEQVPQGSPPVSKPMSTPLSPLSSTQLQLQLPSGFDHVRGRTLITPRGRWRVGKVVMIACKVFSLVSHKWETRPQSSSSEESLEDHESRHNDNSNHPHNLQVSIAMPSVSQYQQSSTRRLAFGGAETDSDDRLKKQLDFYKNTTLTNLSKLFCAIVLLTAFFLVMSRSINFDGHFFDSKTFRQDQPNWKGDEPMGAVCAAPEVKEQISMNRKIEKMMRKQQEDELGNQKLLLLGTGECGKSTILKQMQILHSNGATEKELMDKRPLVYSNLVTGMATIIRALDKFIYQLSDQDREMDARRVLSLAESEKLLLDLTPDMMDTLKNLWADQAIQRAFARRSEFQVGDSLKYFMDDLERIASPSYRPTKEDYLHIRVPTTGVVQVNFPIKQCIFRVFDVGGQRSERRKWIHHFDDVNAVIYICAVNEYDQMLMEDNRTNRMQESMDLFETICNSRWFKQSSMILFLNKKDLFREKIHLVPLGQYFREYRGANTYEDAMSFLAETFKAMNEYRRHRKLYVHETCATDTTQVQFVIDSVIDTVIGKNLRGTGIK
ncbi:unnamed protein product, partial [Mesorhabditis belari]|uniref:Uncharacterized protein n=1 Tax=Mesorhabditis belari TaxID=2138241 RepID=A0AAF3F5V5_9BILA